MGLRNRWLSKEGLKGAVVGVVVFGGRSSVVVEASGGGGLRSSILRSEAAVCHKNKL